MKRERNSMMQAVTNIVAMSAAIPATIWFGVHRYSMFDQITPIKTIAWTSFKGASHAV